MAEPLSSSRIAIITVGDCELVVLRRVHGNRHLTSGQDWANSEVNVNVGILGFRPWFPPRFTKEKNIEEPKNIEETMKNTKKEMEDEKMNSNKMGQK